MGWGGAQIMREAELLGMPEVEGQEEEPILSTHRFRSIQENLTENRDL